MNTLMESRHPSTSLLLGVCILLASSEGLLISQNVTAFVGQSAKIECRKSPNASYPVDWHHRPVGSNTSIHIYSEAGGGFRRGYKEAFDANNSNTDGTYKLVIRNVSTSLAGTYYCVDNDEYSTTAATNLVVIAQKPSCRSNLTVVLGNNDCNLDPDVIQLTCDVPYHGTIPPQLKWLDMYENDIDAERKPSSTILGPGNFRLNVSLPASEIHNRSRYCCRIGQLPIQYSCTTEEIEIIEMKSSEKREIKISAGAINCTSETGSCRNFRWSNGTHEINKKVIEFNDTKYQVHTCLADCEVINRRVTSTCMLYEVQYIQDGEKINDRINIVTLIVIIIAMFLVLAVTISLLLIFRQTKSACFKEPETENGQQQRSINIQAEPKDLPDPNSTNENEQANLPGRDHAESRPLLEQLTLVEKVEPSLGDNDDDPSNHSLIRCDDDSNANGHGQITAQPPSPVELEDSVETSPDENKNNLSQDGDQTTSLPTDVASEEMPTGQIPSGSVVIGSGDQVDSEHMEAESKEVLSGNSPNTTTQNSDVSSAITPARDSPEANESMISSVDPLVNQKKVDCNKPENWKLSKKIEFYEKPKN